VVLLTYTFLFSWTWLGENVPTYVCMHHRVYFRAAEKLQSGLLSSAGRVHIAQAYASLWIRGSKAKAYQFGPRQNPRPQPNITGNGLLWGQNLKKIVTAQIGLQAYTIFKLQRWLLLLICQMMTGTARKQCHFCIIYRFELWSLIAITLIKHDDMVTHLRLTLINDVGSLKCKTPVMQPFLVLQFCCICANPIRPTGETNVVKRRGCTKVELYFYKVESLNLLYIFISPEGSRYNTYNLQKFTEISGCRKIIRKFFFLSVNFRPTMHNLGSKPQFWGKFVAQI